MGRRYVWFLMLCFLLASCAGEGAIPAESPAHRAVLEAYQEILKENGHFDHDTSYSNGNSEDVQGEGNQRVDTNLTALMAQYTKDETVWQIKQFAVIDLDGDGTPELIAELPFAGERLVFYYETGGVVAFSFSHRGLNQPKKDGTFISSGGAAYTQFYRLQFLDGICSKVVLAYSDTIQEGDAVQEVYFMDGEEVSRDVFSAFWEAFGEKEDADWYPYSEETVAEDLAEAWRH